MHFVTSTSNIKKGMMRYDFHMRFWQPCLVTLPMRFRPITSAAKTMTRADSCSQRSREYAPARTADTESGKIDLHKAAAWPSSWNEGDTIWMGAADSSGLVVSYIQSIFWEFGSGCVLPNTGLLRQNRGASFSLDTSATNPLAPGRLPFHTLNPALAVLKDGRIMGYGTMGGDGQPQTQAMLFLRHVMFGEPLDVSLDRPRWLLRRTWGSSHTNLRLESRFDKSVIERLVSAGHDVEVLEETYSDTMGHAGAVILHADGTSEAAHDPRAGSRRHIEPRAQNVRPFHLLKVRAEIDRRLSHGNGVRHGYSHA
jgi:oxamate amidohydrolase